MRRDLRGAAAFGLLGLIGLTGCSTPAEPVAPLLRSASNQTRRGEEAYLDGRAADAVPMLAEAARLHLSAGDVAGAARADLNLALAQRGAGDIASAVATCARMRELVSAARQQTRDRGRDSVSALELDVSADWLDALLLVDRGDLSAAAGRLAAPVIKLPASSPWPGRVANLRAEIAVKEDRWEEALALARTGLAASGAAHERAEEARALRLAGAAEIKLGRWSAARQDLLRAVQMEEQLGGGARMARDLDQLAIIAEQSGDRDDAQLYSQRARAIMAARTR